MGRHDDEDEGSSVFGTIGVLLVAPIAATLLQLAISRSACGDDAGARSARQRAVPPRAGSRLLPMDRSPASAHLFVVNPPSSGSVMGLFATHPPIGARIEKLLAMRG